MMIRVQDKLPKTLMDELKACEGVTFMEGDLGVLDLRESEAGKQIYRAWLADGVEVDPLVQPNFGPWFNQFVGMGAQGEVHGLLETYRTLAAAANFNVGVYPPFVVGVGPFYQYQHSKIALHAVQAEIENPTQYLANCPILAGLPGGNPICDLQMNYANCAVVLRLRKF
eukprot:scaffold4358_cov177-Ochromonas_danica.AAC.18